MPNATLAKTAAGIHKARTDNITQLCEQHLSGADDPEIINVYQQPELAVEPQRVAAPTLFKLQPLPPRKTIGNLSDTGRVLAGLAIPR